MRPFHDKISDKIPENLYICRHSGFNLESRGNMARMFYHYRDESPNQTQRDEKDKKGHKVTMGIKRACKIYISFSLKWIDTEKSLHLPSFRIQSEISGKHGTNVLLLRDETSC